MSYGSEDDLVREYEMIWTLFNSKYDAVEEEAGCACGPQDGIAVRILKFLFGSDRQQDDCENYEEKRPFHRHIHQPATRSRDKPLGTDTDTTKASAPESRNQSVNRRIQAEMESALVARPSLEMPGPEGFQPGFAPGRRVAPHERLLRVVSALIMGAIVLICSSTWATFKKYVLRRE